MQHVKPSSKGDPLCPLGFHPQVRWPGRCKRCFRDYKEHGNRNKEQDTQLKKDELTVSTPALSSYSQSKGRSESSFEENSLRSRNWTSSSNLSTIGKNEPKEELSRAASSWTSSTSLPDAKDESSSVTVSITLPRRRSKLPDEDTIEDDARRTQYTVRRRTSPLMSSGLQGYDSPKTTTSTTSSSSTSSQPKTESVLSKYSTSNVSRVDSKPPLSYKSNFKKVDSDSEEDTERSTRSSSISGKSLQEEMSSLKKELAAMKARCEKAEREKSDFMLRRLASSDTISSRTSASEVLKLQQKLNEMTNTTEDLRQEKRTLSQKVRELETDLQVVRATGAQREIQTLKEKLQKSDKLCKELTSKNGEIQKELRDMADEMDEIQDKFREDRADEYTSLKKELEQQTKNCRILSFKLRKAERKAEQLEAEKLEAERKCREVAGGQTGLDKVERIKQLEHDLSVANEAAARLQKELDDANSKLKTTDKDKSSGGAPPIKKKAPKLGSIARSSSTDKMSRESLTRGDSQEDPVQLLRDLQDSLEREADLREQLRFAEEEAANLRKKSSRVEDDNESLVLQLKKMATKARTRRHSPSHNLTPEPVEKDEGISDEEDPSELRVLLELSEQEAAVLRRKVEDLEVEGDHHKRKVQELQEKLNNKTASIAAVRRSQIQAAEPGKADGVYDQKIKVLEEEMSELRLKVIEKERECERLHAELSVGGKKNKSLQKSRSLDVDQQAVDLKRQLQVIETETNVLRMKTQDLEQENDKLQMENRRLTMLSASRRSSSVERTGDVKTISTLEKQLEECNKKIKELEASNKSPGTKQGPLAIGELEKLKNQLKKVETDKKKLEETLNRLKDEAIETIAEFYVKRTPKKPTDITTKLQLKKMVDDLECEIGEILVLLKRHGGVKTERDVQRLKSDLEATRVKFEEQIKQAKEEAAKKDSEIEKLNKLVKDLQSDKNKSEKNKSSLDKEKEKLNSTITELEKKIKEKDLELDKLKAELEKEKKEISALKQKIETEKTGSKKTDEINRKVEELENKLKEAEEKIKKTEKLLASKKEKLLKTEKEHDELTNKLRDLEKINNDLLGEKKTLESKYSEADKKLQSLQSKVLDTKEEKKTTSSIKSTKEMNELKDELKAAKDKITDLNNKINKAEEELKKSQAEFEKKEKLLQKEINDWEKKASELEMDLQADRKLMERTRAAQEKESENKDLEIAQLKADALASSSSKIVEMQTTIDRLEMALDSEKREYDELTSKYEQLEEEHVVMKATLVKDKEKMQNKLTKNEIELEELEEEMKEMRDKFNAKQDCWIKEKLKFEDKMNELETLAMEKNRLQAICDEKQSQIEQCKKENQVLTEQLSYIRKDNEELRKQIEDFDKFSKIHRNMTADVASLEKELKEYKTKLVMEEKTRKTELTKLRNRYEHRIGALSEEMMSVQGQMARFKRERDTYRKMVEDAHKNIADVRTAGLPEGDNLRTHLASLEQQISSLEDELSESRVEASRLRTELVSERSSWEVKLSELNSKLNELEEEKIMISGRTKITGLKTKMELAWHKEREEQHRLLHETSTLARDLRQTLFEVERERDRERLEGKRRLEQLKKAQEEEQEELRKKLSEMQCDLLELRDAHAKLRTTNEKLRREKDKLDRDRELLRHSLAMKKRLDQEEERQIISVAQLVDELTVLAPDLFPSKPKPPPTMPTPPARRKGSKSREASPLLERKDYSRESSIGREDAKTQEVNEILRRLTEAATELRKSQREPSTSRSYSSFRASSIESDLGESNNTGVKRRTGLQRRGSTLRKSLSLEHTMGQEQAIYMDDTEGSMTSIEDTDKYSMLRRDPSLDSRLSGGSTKSEQIPSSGDKKKKLGIFGKLKKLTKSRSIEQETSDLGSSGQLDEGSDLSLAEDRGKTKDKFSIFKKSGSTSRGNSLERNTKPPTPKLSAERPLTTAGESSSRPLTKKPPSTAPMQRKAKK